MRKYSIDELPQFLDVLRGDMSVVGPRPQVRREVDTYDDLVHRRLVVKPGLTGLWRISGRSDLEVEDTVRRDLTYVENWSLTNDIAIIARTVRTVLRGAGACTPQTTTPMPGKGGGLDWRRRRASESVPNRHRTERV